MRKIRSVYHKVRTHLYNNGSKYRFSILLLTVSFIGAFIGAYRGESTWSRAGVFFLVALVLLAELLAIVGHTESDMWDFLGISMAFFRASIINYIASLAVSFIGFFTYPLWWWNASRTVMGIFAAVSLLLMVEEDFRAWREMTKIERFKAVIAPILYTAFIFAIAIIW